MKTYVWYTSWEGCNCFHLESKNGTTLRSKSWYVRPVSDFKLYRTKCATSTNVNSSLSRIKRSSPFSLHIEHKKRKNLKRGSRIWITNKLQMKLLDEITYHPTRSAVLIQIYIPGGTIEHICSTEAFDTILHLHHNSNTSVLCSSDGVSPTEDWTTKMFETISL